MSVGVTRFKVTATSLTTESLMLRITELILHAKDSLAYLQRKDFLLYFLVKLMQRMQMLSRKAFFKWSLYSPGNMFLFTGAVFLNTDYRPDGVYVIADYTDGVREHAFYPYEELSKSYNGQHDEALRIAGIEDEYYMTQEYQL